MYIHVIDIQRERDSTEKKGEKDEMRFEDGEELKNKRKRRSRSFLFLTTSVQESQNSGWMTGNLNWLLTSHQ